MDNQDKPNARKKRIVGEGKGIEKKGEGLGTGPVGQTSQQPPKTAFTQQPPKTAFTQQPARPAQSAQSQQPAQNVHRPVQPPQRPSQNPFAQNSHRTGQSSSAQSRPQAGMFGHTRPSAQAQRPVQAQRPAQSQRPASARPDQAQNASQGQRTGSSRGGGSGKLILLIAVIAIAFFVGKNLFGGGNSGNTNLSVNNTSSTAQTQTQSATANNGGIMNLLSSFLGSSSSTAYDFSGVLSGLTGGSGSAVSASGASQYFTTSMENNTSSVDTTVYSGARDKFTVIKGNKEDKVTVLVYMCGADLESQNGMATSDLKEMVNANLSGSVNLLVYTGGAKRWKNNVVNPSVNQIYKIENGSLTRLVENDGSASMTKPSTLSGFIRFGYEKYPANRMVLIFWDHGGGSVSGYGYDERYGAGQTMTLAGINEALQSAGVKFDFIGFDTCLMATVENGLMLSQYADYMVASEETEPGTGWYYTNWLNKISANPSISTVQIGKNIVDDFVEVSNRQCRGQATTLSVVDLAELSATIPAELKSFSINTNELIQNKQYKKVSGARSKTQEFAQSSRIDQIDLVHFAKNMGTEEGKRLADALQGAIKYNRTGGGISNAYGLSIYFPYKKAGKVTQMVSTYKAIGMDDEYTRCIQEFASLEVSGQISGGSTAQTYSSNSAASGLMESLMGGGSSYSNIGNIYSSGGLEDLLGGYFGGGSSSSGSTGSILDLLMGRSMTAAKAAAYIQENHFDPSVLQWKDGRITLSDGQWANLVNVQKSLYFDDGNGYIWMGFDPDITRDGNDLVYEFDGTWLSIDRQPVAYYRIGSVEQAECYAEIGYVPAIVNGVRANLILVFDAENPYGYIAGAEPVYPAGETDTQAKNLTGIGKGDKIQFVCDYVDYKGNYKDSYRLGDPIVLGAETEIGNTYVDAAKCRLTYCLTDYYQQQYWTPVK